MSPWKVLLLGTAFVWLHQAARAEPQRDSDQDGLSDELELQTGTDPLRADTDYDGVPDGIEDANRDGVTDPGETDPRRHGLFPGTYPHIPEPLVFDLVRGLGARRGELEVNTLVVVDLRRGPVLWAPEVEWAFAEGYALELELPLVDRELEAVKLALQGTLPSPWPDFTHGWQTFAEIGLDEGNVDTVLLYIWGQRFAGKWSYLNMGGARLSIDRPGPPTAVMLVNSSLFVDAREWQTWGIETNMVAGVDEWAVRVFPQAHFQVNRRFRLQLSVGVELNADRVSPLGAVRVILE